MGHITFTPGLELDKQSPGLLPEEREGREPVSVLLEMRPALDGFAGIPQETRLLFRGLRLLDGVRLQGLIQHPVRRLARGTRADVRAAHSSMAPARVLNRYSRVIVSLAERPFKTVFDKIRGLAQKGFANAELAVTTLLRIRTVRLSDFDATHFPDFVWRTLFAKTLPASDYKIVTCGTFKICSVPWRTMHLAGLYSLNASKSPTYPRLDTRGIDVFIAQTPYPGRVHKGTTLVVRYHDALPVFMPHTIPDKSMHQATHFYALMENVKAGAWFACVSEATRQDLLKLFPEAGPRAVTIHNMVSHHYHPEELQPGRVSQIIRTRLYQHEGMVPAFSGPREQEQFYRKSLGDVGFRYLMVVSTIEPRKNHLRLLAGWEAIKAHVDPDLKLVVVGTLGWDNDAITKGFKPWLERGDLFCLNAVPAADLRVLYRGAAATVCPSIGEGFDFSGVEAMASGGVVIASDIPVHREVYDDACEYFNPYSTSELVASIRKVLYAEESGDLQQQHRRRGFEVASRYAPGVILQQWEAFLNRLTDPHGPVAGKLVLNNSAVDKLS
jgi:glycosyltransferase involved in cell wall biosynthesis